MQIAQLNLLTKANIYKRLLYKVKSLDSLLKSETLNSVIACTVYMVTNSRFDAQDVNKNTKA